MKINVFFFISGFNYGGAGNAIFNFLKNLDRKKYNINILFLENSEYQKHLPKDVNFYNINNKTFVFKTFFSFFKIRKIILKKTEENKKNIFISNIHYSNILTIFFLRNLRNLKIFLFERTSLKELDIYFNFISFFKNKVTKLLLNKFYNKADKVLTNSKVLSSELKSFNINSRIVYSGLIEKILKEKVFKKKSFFKIISVGRLTQQKDFLTLLKAVKLIKSNNFCLEIYGDGPLKKNLENEIIENNLTKYVKIHGHQVSKDKIYHNADLLVHTSIFEGLPNVIVEAINYSVPVIASDGAGGTKEILNKGKFGLLFNVKNSHDLAKKVDNFINNPFNLQKKILDARFLLKNFTAQNTTNELEKIIDSVFK